MTAKSGRAKGGRGQQKAKEPKAKVSGCGFAWHCGGRTHSLIIVLASRPAVAEEQD